MKRTLWNITFASIITLVAYIALYAIWGAILSGLENPTLRLLIIALMTTLAFGFFLVYTSKIRKRSVRMRSFLITKTGNMFLLRMILNWSWSVNPKCWSALLRSFWFVLCSTPLTVWYLERKQFLFRHSFSPRCACLIQWSIFLFWVTS